MGGTRTVGGLVTLTGSSQELPFTTGDGLLTVSVQSLTSNSDSVYIMDSTGTEIVIELIAGAVFFLDVSSSNAFQVKGTLNEGVYIMGLYD